jgi:hypothetical protein
MASASPARLPARGCRRLNYQPRCCPSMSGSRWVSCHSWPSFFYWSALSVSSKCAGHAGLGFYPVTRLARSELSGRPSVSPPVRSRPMTSTPRQLLARYSGVLAVILFCTERAFVHVQKGEAAGFLSGLRHRVSGLDHVLGWWPWSCGAHNWAHVQSGSSQSHFPWLWHSGMLALIGTPLPGIEYGIELQASWARIAVRVAGSWIFANGLFLLGWAARNAHMRAP